MPNSIEMPHYKCHKEVWALKIKEVQYAAGEGTPSGARETKKLVFENSRYAPMEVDADYVRKHDPQVGGYYVVYMDGYKSFSPAQTFEEGYNLIGKFITEKIEIPILNSREFLFALSSKAEKTAKVISNPGWKRAYLALSDAADRLDAMVARITVKGDK